MNRFEQNFTKEEIELLFTALTMFEPEELIISQFKEFKSMKDVELVHTMLYDELYKIKFNKK